MPSLVASYNFRILPEIILREGISYRGHPIRTYTERASEKWLEVIHFNHAVLTCRERYCASQRWRPARPALKNSLALSLLSDEFAARSHPMVENCMWLLLLLTTILATLPQRCIHSTTWNFVVGSLARCMCGWGVRREDRSVMRRLPRPLFLVNVVSRGANDHVTFCYYRSRDEHNNGVANCKLTTHEKASESELKTYMSTHL